MFPGKGKIGKPRTVRQRDNAFKGPAFTGNADEYMIFNPCGLDGITDILLSGSILGFGIRRFFPCFGFSGPFTDNLAVESDQCIFKIEQILLFRLVFVDSGIQGVEQNQRRQAVFFGQAFVRFAVKLNRGFFSE